MVRSVTVFDEDFTLEDMTSALDWKAQRANICECGQPIDESMAVGADDDYEAELVACHSCAAKDRAVRAFRESRSPVMDGLKTRVRRVD